MIHDIVLPAYVGTRSCTHRIFYEPTQTIRINPMSCGCDRKLRLCMYQSEDRNFVMDAGEGADLSGAIEILFDIWTKPNGTLLMSKTQTGGDIVLANPHTATFDISNSESGALPAGSLYCEFWAQFPGDVQSTLGTGQFRLIDTEKFD